MRDILVTNNPLTEDLYKSVCSIDFVDGKYKDVLKRVRDYVHKGHKLLSHPLSGSVKPNENPYKSVLVSSLAGAGGKTDVDSLNIIENAIITADKFPQKYKSIPQEILSDFATVDLTLISSAFSNR